MKWQPIETAPKDGTDFLVFKTGSVTQFIDDSNPILGIYPGGDWNVSKVNQVDICAWLHEWFYDSQGFSYGEDFIETENPDGSPDGDPPLTLTLWMPLPEPPEDS